MPYSEVKDAGWDKLRAELAALLEPYAIAFGPRECPHGDWSECDDEDCGFADSQPTAGSMPMVKDWVLVVATEDMASDSPHLAVVQAPGMRSHNRSGLLHEALYG